jgi:TonB-linked SusC/RagA family outer membrane protein
MITSLLRTRNLTFILLFAVCLLPASRLEAQAVTISLNDVSLKEALRQIQRQTGVNVLFDESLLSRSENVTVRVKNSSLEDVLKLCFKDQPVKYSLVDKTIVLKSNEFAQEKKSVIVTDTLRKPVVIVTGKVTDENGYPLVRVSVQNANTKKGTYSGEDGSFRIPVSEGDILHISYVGYRVQIIKSAFSANNLQIKLEPAESKSEEVIVTGYQQIRKSQMTGSIARVKADKLQINGTTTLEQTLQGKLSGVDIVSNSGLVGTRQTVRVRGTSTLLGNQEPVWVVDGIIQEDPLPFKASELNHFGGESSNSERIKNFVGSAVAWLNPYDIEDVTVLKDAASTAIYGVKAANGVILITTKRGKTGSKPVVSYNASASTQTRLSYDKMNLMNSKERVDVSREIWERGLISLNSLDDVGYSGLLKQYMEQKLSYAEFNVRAKQLEVNNTDWFDILFQQPVSQSHSVSVSGGGTNNNYYGSFSAASMKGTARGNGSNSYSGTVNFVSNVTPRLSFAAKLAGSYSKTDGFFNIDPYGYASKTSRVIPAYEENGALSYYNYYNSGFKYNILNELANSGNLNVRTGLNAAINVRYRLPGGFSIESIFGVGYANLHAESYATERTNRITAQRRGYEFGQYRPIDQQYRMSQLPNGGELATMESRNINYTWRNGINYGQIFNKKHAVTALLGMELRSNIYKGSNLTQFGYQPDRGKIIIPPAATIENAVGTLIANPIYASGLMTSNITDNKSNYVSYYVTGSYTYNDRYTFNASLRGDASNRFGQDTRNRFRPIWAFGARWNIAREQFFAKTSWFNDFAIRASYGYQGNVAEGYGPELIARIPSGASGINNLTGDPILTISNLPYANLRWEKTQTINLGLDFSFLNGRINASLDYYNKNSKDLIIMKDVPYENGVVSMPMNGGTLTNSGIDLSMNFIPVRTKNFLWTIGLTSSKIYNQITNRQMQNPTWITAKSGSYHVDGYAVSSFWVFDYTGLDSATGKPLFNIPTVAQNPDAKSDASAFMKYGGKLNPDFTGGFSTSLRYKMFTISTNIYLSVGASKLLAPLYTPDITRTTPNEYNNLSKDMVNRWRTPGDHLTASTPSLPTSLVAVVPIPSGANVIGSLSQPSTESPYTLYNFSTARLVDASYLRINNINFNYALTEKLAKKIYAKSASIGYTIGNVHTFASKDLKGLDPEVASGNQPLPLTHALTLNVTF